jgi:large subunit ribosomal protein L10
MRTFLFDPLGKEESRLAITRKKKEQLIAQYKEAIDNASAIVFTDYRGVTVSQIQSLRTKLQESGTQYMVAKNTLLGIALADRGYPKSDELLSGPNGVAFLGEDIGQGVTAIEDWIKAEKILEISGALLD